VSDEIDIIVDGIRGSLFPLVFGSRGERPVELGTRQAEMGGIRRGDLRSRS